MVHIPVNKELEMAEAIVILYINFFSPRLAKTVSFVILLCLTLTISLVKREPLGGKGILVKIKDGGADLRRTQINMVKSKAY